MSHDDSGLFSQQHGVPMVLQEEIQGRGGGWSCGQDIIQRPNRAGEVRTMRASRSGGRNMSLTRVNWEDNCLHSCVHTVPPKCCKLLQRSYAYAGVSVTKISVNQYNYMYLNTRVHGAWPMLIKTLWYQPSRVAAAMAHCCSDNDISVILVARLNYPSFEATPHTNYSWLN